MIKSKNDFADVIRDLAIGKLSQCNDKGFYKRQTGRSEVKEKKTI